MQPTKTLPQNYQPRFKFSLKDNLGAAVVLNLGALAAFFGFGALFIRISALLRSDHLLSGFRDIFDVGQAANLLVILLIMLILHEGFHGIFFWIYTKERPKFGIKLLYAYAAAPEWYIPRSQFIVVGMAPILFLSIIGLFLLPFLPPRFIPGLIFFLTINAAGSLADLYTIFILVLQPKTVLVEDLGESFTVYGPPNEGQLADNI